MKGRVLVIAEKPKASKKIAFALSSNPAVHRYKNIPYYEIRTSTNIIFVASAAGHLYELHTDKNEYPVFNYAWIPSYMVNDEKRFTKSYIELLELLSRECDYYVNACDYDIEGSVIGYLIIKFLGDEKRAFRAKFSSLVQSELRTSFTQLMPLDYNMIEAGLCRHELDWIWGINISRALMNAVYKATNKKTVLSVGRVQTPTLKYVVEKTLERKLFIPLPQFTISITLSKGSTIFRAEYVENPVKREEDARAVEETVKKYGHLVVREVSSTKQKLQPPPPFNLSDLQEEAARIYGFSPMETQKIAEELYLDALISYPRTNSQKLPPGLDYRDILTKLSGLPQYSALVTKLIHETKGILKPVQGDKDDPAHPAIYPTGVQPRSLTKKQWAIYDLIVRRFLAVFSHPAILVYTKAVLSTPNHEYNFQASGLQVESLGWLTYYPFHKPHDRPIVALKTGELVKVRNVNVRESYTKPPSKLKKIDLLRWMESVGIGTESTRAPIIEKLFDRKYLVSDRGGIEVTDLGYGIVEIVERFFPDLGSVELTRAFETLVNHIMNGQVTREQVVLKAKDVIKDLLNRFDEHSIEVGKLLSRRLWIRDDYEKCLILNCRREAHMSGLCKYHYEAREILRNTFKEWAHRKKVTYEEYINKLLKLKTTGEYVKEVIQYYNEAGSRKTPKSV